MIDLIDKCYYDPHMKYSCHRCGSPLELGPNAFTARNDECPKCRADMHACLNCKHYERGAYNDCREPQSERVVDKERANFCDYFAFSTKDKAGTSPKGDALKKLDDLFK